MARISTEAFELKSLRGKIDSHYRKNLKQVLNVKCPCTLKTKDILAIKPMAVEDDLLWKGCVFFLVDAIISRTERKKFKSGNRAKGFVGLKFELLRDVIGKDLKLTITTLVSHGIIETDGVYSPGKESIGYRLCKQYRKSRIRFVAISNPAIVKRHQRLQERFFLEQRSRLRKHAYLIKWFLDNTLKIDKSAATDYLENFKKRIEKDISKLGLSHAEVEEVSTHIDNTISTCLNIIDNWDKPRPIIDGKGGRLYSPLTTIMSQLRYFVKYKDQHLVYFDIRNSQPFHLLLLLNPKFWSKPKNSREITLHNLNKDLEEYIKEKKKEDYNTTIMMLKEFAESGKHLTNRGLQRLSTTSPRYAYMVATGKLYKFISDEFRGKFVTTSGWDPFLTAVLAKKELIRMLYFNPIEKHSPSQKYFAEFRKLFPTEANVIDLLKSRRHQDFSIMLQKVESKILLGEVCKTIFTKDSSIPMFTIHDGIMTTIEHANQVEEIIKGTYKSIIGVEPELSKEYMTHENAYRGFQDYAKKKVREILVEMGKEPRIFLSSSSNQDTKTVFDLFCA